VRKAGRNVARFNVIYLGDCLKIMDYLPKNSVDLLLTDPPLNLLAHAADIQPSVKFRTKLIRTQHKWDEYPKGDYLKFMRDWIEKSMPLLKEDCNFVSFIADENISYLGEILKEHGFKKRNHFVWVKTNPVPHLRKVNFAFGTELMMWFSRGKNTFNYKLGHQPNFLITPTVQVKQLCHPTQKPLHLMELLIRYLSNENDLVFDPFCGSGTTCVAAKKLGRRFIGIEITPEYCRTARKRINNVPEKLKKWY